MEGHRVAVAVPGDEVHAGRLGLAGRDAELDRAAGVVDDVAADDDARGVGGATTDPRR